MKIPALQIYRLHFFLVNTNIIHILQYSHFLGHELAYFNFQFAKLIYHVTARFSFEVRQSRIALSNVEMQIWHAKMDLFPQLALPYVSWCENKTIKYVHNDNATEARIRLDIETGLEFNQSEERKSQKISSLVNFVLLDQISI